jgi:DNA-binding NarL/FixJ family response regulator
MDKTREDACRILVFDRHDIYRIGLCNFIDAEVRCAEVIGASSLDETLYQIRNGVFDLVLVGTDRSGLGRLDCLKAAREASRVTRFAIVSTCDTREDILATLAAGFHGFISKRQAGIEILAAITNILSGRIYVPASFAEVGDRTALGGLGGEVQISTKSNMLKLTKRQREVLTLLARGLSNKEIARALDIAEATTKIHMAALLRGLGVRNRTEAAFKAANLVNSFGLDSASQCRQAPDAVDRVSNSSLESGRIRDGR